MRAIGDEWAGTVPMQRNRDKGGDSGGMNGKG